ncbi:DUF4124 domain-containing protein [Luteimonas sp. WGS1318]|uniref:DUF4124 domain-containing protein n=1 Tax=Luteimonas sp. WGS1318 TaxID=3366815 RepID=UPI00372CFC0F
MRRIDSVVLLALLAVTAASPLAANEVYSWKDANGVTHYSQTPPPPGTRFEVRGIRNDAPTATAAPVATPTAATAAAASSTDTSQCEVARANIAALEGDAPVQQLGADGTPRELDAQGRSSQLELAQAAVRAYCR